MTTPKDAQTDAEFLRGLTTALQAANRGLAFARSALKSGEPWTNTCETTIGAAFVDPAVLDRLQAVIERVFPEAKEK